MKTTFKLLALCGVLTTILALSSCRDQDFDWESAKKANSEYNYAKNFSQIYGSIDPNQSWDFSYYGRHAGDATRAGGNKGGTSTLDGEGGSSNSDGQTMRPTYYTDLSTVDGITRSWTYLNEDVGEWVVKFLNKLTGNNDKIILGGQFVMQAPYCGFKVTPLVFHMNNGNGYTYENIELHMCVQTGTITYDDYLLWTDKPGAVDVYHYNGDWQAMDKQTDGGGFKGSNIKSNSFVFGTKDDPLFTPESTIWFYTKYIGGGHNSEINSSQGTIVTEKGDVKGTMVEFKIADNKTNPIYQVKDENGNVIHEYIMIGCELDRHATNSGQFNYGDFIFLLEGIPFVPQREEIHEGSTPRTQRKVKRYMVEDMGYSAYGSEAVNKGYTDIDFNDVVIDISEVRSWLETWQTSTTSPVPVYKIENETTTQEATIRALGGTWDFEFYIGGTKIFTKSAIPSSAINSAYPFFAGKPNPTIQSNIIYNTYVNAAGNSRAAGDYTTTDSWLAKFENISGWVPADNNVSFKIVGDTQYGPGFNQMYDSSTENTDNGDSVTETKHNVYELTFPAKGATPKIVAFDPTKAWQTEKTPVQSTWFSN